jgi:serine/threonine protein kinase
MMKIPFNVKVDWDKPLGRGGQGDVYLGYRQLDRLPLAVKVVENYHMCKSECCRGKVPREACMLQRCRDIAGVVKMHGFFLTGSMALIAMEYVPNTMDLFDYMNKYGYLGEAASKQVFKDVVKTVIDMRERGIVHGDIKDENILIHPKTGKTLLIDLGMAYRTLDSSKSRAAGTKVYNPPEYFVNAFCDWEPQTVWSLGCLLYLLTHGQEAFCNEKETIKNRPQMSEDLSDGLKNLLSGMLESDSTKRLTIDKVFSHKWMT